MGVFPSLSVLYIEITRKLSQVMMEQNSSPSARGAVKVRERKALGDDIVKVYTVVTEVIVPDAVDDCRFLSLRRTLFVAPEF